MRDRREFLRSAVLASLAIGGGLCGLAGCEPETKKTGTVVEMPPEDLASLEASAAAYEAETRAKAKKK